MDSDYLHIWIRFQYLNTDGLVETYLGSGADINTKYADGSTLLHLAVAQGNIDTVKLVLSKGANVNMEDEHRITPLQIAIAYGDTEIVEVLLDRGADVNPKRRINPLLTAVFFGQIKIVKKLLDRGADLNTKCNMGQTSLHLAMYGKCVDMVKFLLNKGANVNAKNKYMYTPLHLATNKCIKEIVEILLDNGADINAEDKDGCTPLKYAIKLHNPQKYRFLLQRAIKMKIDGSYISDKNSKLIESDTEFYNMCKTEIQNMKSETIGDSCISFYDILGKSRRKLATCLRNENILQVLESSDYKTRFPIYGYLISEPFISGKTCKELLERGANVIRSNIKKIPDDCIDDILSYLSDEDIRGLINAWNEKFYNKHSSVVKIDKK